MPEFSGATIAKIAQGDESRLQCRAGFFGRFPNVLAFVQIRAVLQKIIDFIDRDWLSLELELEAVERGGLFRFGCDPVRNQFRIGHRSFGSVKQNLLEFANCEWFETSFLFKQFAGFADDRGIAIERGARLMA